MAVEIPAPKPGDSDKLVTSLENAALFGRIGDNEETLRWLQRAAEFASESGDDARTLALARTASELKSSMLPPAPAPADATHDEPTLLLTRPAIHRPVPPSSRPLGSRPAPPSARGLPPPTGAPSSKSTTSSSPLPTRSASTNATPMRAHQRQAARVSVEKSASESGLFLVRLLEDGQRPTPGCSEALLVELDPSTPLFLISRERP